MKTVSDRGARLRRLLAGACAAGVSLTAVPDLVLAATLSPAPLAPLQAESELLAKKGGGGNRSNRPGGGNSNRGNSNRGNDNRGNNRNTIRNLNRGSGSGFLTRPAPGFNRGNRRPGGGWVDRVPSNGPRPIKPGWTRPNRPNRPNWNRPNRPDWNRPNRPNWNRPNWNRPNWILNRPININTIKVKPKWWRSGWRRARPWRYGWYNSGPARWSWWNRSSIGWGITSLTSAALIAAAIDNAINDDRPTVTVNDSPYDLVYGSVQATGDQTATFSFTLAGNAYQASADCGSGLLDGQAPDSPEEAQLLNAACEVAFGSL